MVVRKRKKLVNKMLGQRTRGNGDTKRRRGAGSRGGRGLAGSHKHKYSKYAGKFGQEKKKVRSRNGSKPPFYPLTALLVTRRALQKLPVFFHPTALH